MDTLYKAIFGSSLTAVGTVIAAVGATPFRALSTGFRLGLDVNGNALQAVGNGLEADTLEDGSYGRIGGEIQSLGNSTVIAGLILPFNFETKEKFIITGNWLQALGGTTSIESELSEPEPDADDALAITGKTLQVIGNTLQAINGINLLRESRIQTALKYPESAEEAADFYSLGVIGSWIQAVGAIISLISVIGLPDGSRFGNQIETQD
ncbi:DUF6944 family repetitive protein [Rossellomorea marisflavi]|uniref:DUF6944 family repetitive protein n=1 Tax=Rossellomorea marisflavi TaxID=189381 RepID=UPI00065003F7|nr:hypothetical protein [Rossellomorea marisflavi]KMK91821.1 hypothetical protein VL03_17820 [Rossellomorea marisflavi]TYO69792.1 hypothetical protein DQ398_003637 [Rossellomorea marisflavi]